MNKSLLGVIAALFLALGLIGSNTISTISYIDSHSVAFDDAKGRVLAATTNGLIGYWNFDEGSGATANDTSDSGNNGTITGATWTTGKVGSGALSFNGTSAHVNAGSASNLDDLTSFTYSAWINPANIAQGNVYWIFGKTGNYGSNKSLVIHGGGAGTANRLAGYVITDANRS